MVPVDVVAAVTEYCWLQQNGPVRVDVVVEESLGDSLVDAIQPPARDCARVDVEDA
jgi:hypothetical protein